jgi:hypothetical protein
MKCVPGKTEQLWYWPILEFYSEILRAHKKTNPAFKEHLGFVETDRTSEKFFDGNSIL